MLFLAVLAARLLFTGLYRSYKTFTLFIVALCLESVLLLFFGGHRKTYLRVWTFSRLAILPLELLAAYAVFRHWTVSFPGIGAFGKRLVVVLLVISIGVSVATVPIAWSANGMEVALQLMAIVNRCVNACCACFLLLTLIFFYKFGGPVAPNLNRHTWALAAFVTANAISYLILGGPWFKVANVLLPAVSLATLGYWIVALTKAGEIQPATAPNPEEWATAAEMNQQLLKLADSVTLTPHGLRKK